MKKSEKKDIEKYFHDHKDFSECIIEELVLKDYGTTLEVVFNYIWTDTGELRPNVNEPNDIILRFNLVQELQICNALTASMLRSPESINWGLNEVALLKVIDDQASRADETSCPPLTHVAFLWEGDRRIDVVFVELEVLYPKR
jgi:hypothetical protein